MTIQTATPQKFTAGDTLTWQVTIDDYPASAGWQLHYVLINALNKITIDASASGADHLVNIAASASANYTFGDYTWQAYVTKNTERHTLENGSLTILQNLASFSTGVDLRSHVKKTLDAIESWLESKNPAVAEYEISGRRMRYISIPDLLKLRDRYKAELKRENMANGISGGGRGKLQVRF